MHCHAEPSQQPRPAASTRVGWSRDWTLAAPEPDGGRQSDHHETFASQAEFASNQPHEGSPVTGSGRRPDARSTASSSTAGCASPTAPSSRSGASRTRRSGRRFPAPVIRVTEGAASCTCTLEPSKRVAHDPPPRHGAGPAQRRRRAHLVRGDRRATPTSGGRTAGSPGDPNWAPPGRTSTTATSTPSLHVQMGMFGPLIVDPVVHPDFPVPPGARRSFVDGPLYDIATEALLVPYCGRPALARARPRGRPVRRGRRAEPLRPEALLPASAALLAATADHGDVLAPTQLARRTCRHGAPHAVPDART